MRFRLLPLTCSFEEYLTRAAGFLATQVYSPECADVKLEIPRRLEYGSRALMFTPSLGGIVTPSFNQLIDPFVT